MSVQSHLTARSRSLILSANEIGSINKSIATLQTRLDAYFVAELEEHFLFGSVTRGTILPREYDAESDIDYLIVFKDQTLQPRTYLDKLRRFVDKHYGSSERKQSHPTIKLSLNHITFELVPAISFYSYYRIPAPNSDYQDWMDTDPLSFAAELSAANQRYNSQLKPAMRLLKYWNCLNGRPYSSYLLECFLARQSYWSSNIKGLFYEMVKNLPVSWNDTDWLKKRVERAQDIVRKTEQLERAGYLYEAEAEIKKLIP